MKFLPKELRRNLTPLLTETTVRARWLQDALIKADPLIQLGPGELPQPAAARPFIAVLAAAFPCSRQAGRFRSALLRKVVLMTGVGPSSLENGS